MHGNRENERVKSRQRRVERDWREEEIEIHTNTYANREIERSRNEQKESAREAWIGERTKEWREKSRKR